MPPKISPHYGSEEEEREEVVTRHRIKRIVISGYQYRPASIPDTAPADNIQNNVRTLENKYATMSRELARQSSASCTPTPESRSAQINPSQESIDPTTRASRELLTKHFDMSDDVEGKADVYTSRDPVYQCDSTCGKEGHPAPGNTSSCRHRAPFGTRVGGLEFRDACLSCGPDCRFAMPRGILVNLNRKTRKLVARPLPLSKTQTPSARLSSPATASQPTTTTHSTAGHLPATPSKITNQSLTLLGARTAALTKATETTPGSGTKVSGQSDVSAIGALSNIDKPTAAPAANPTPATANGQDLDVPSRQSSQTVPVATKAQDPNVSSDVKSVPSKETTVPDQRLAVPLAAQSTNLTKEGNEVSKQGAPPAARNELSTNMTNAKQNLDVSRSSHAASSTALNGDQQNADTDIQKASTTNDVTASVNRARFEVSASPEAEPINALIAGMKRKEQEDDKIITPTRMVKRRSSAALAKAGSPSFTLAIDRHVSAIYDAARREFEPKLLKLEEEAETLEEKVTSLEQEKADLTSVGERKATRILELEKAVETVKAELEASKQASRVENETRETVVAELSTEVTDKTKQIAELRKKLEEHKAFFANLTTSLAGIQAKSTDI